MTVFLHVVLAVAGLKSQVHGQHRIKRPNVNPFCGDLRLKEAVLIVLRPPKGVTRRLSHPFLRRGGVASAGLSPYHFGGIPFCLRFQEHVCDAGSSPAWLLCAPLKRQFITDKLVCLSESSGPTGRPISAQSSGHPGELFNIFAGFSYSHPAKAHSTLDGVVEPEGVEACRYKWKQ